MPLAVQLAKQMKAIRLHGSPGNAKLSLDEIPVPKTGTGEVLIRVHATAVTPGELEWYPTWHTQKDSAQFLVMNSPVQSRRSLRM